MILQYFLLMALVCHSSVQMVHFCWQRNPTNHRNALFLDIPSFTVLRAHFKTSSLLHQMGAWWIEPQYKVAQGVIVAAWRCLKRPHKTMVLFVTMAVIFWFSFIKIFKGLPICCFYGVPIVRTAYVTAFSRHMKNASHMFGVRADGFALYSRQMCFQEHLKKTKKGWCHMKTNRSNAHRLLLHEVKTHSLYLSLSLYIYIKLQNIFNKILQILYL